MHGLRVLTCQHLSLCILRLHLQILTIYSPPNNSCGAHVVIVLRCIYFYSCEVRLPELFGSRITDNLGKFIPGSFTPGYFTLGYFTPDNSFLGNLIPGKIWVVTMLIQVNSVDELWMLSCLVLVWLNSIDLTRPVACASF